MILHVLPLLVFTTFAGFAAGAYAVDAVCGNGREAKTPWLFPLVCVVLLGIGLRGTLAHLGQPLRFMNGMANPASGISQESYWAIALGIVVVVDLVISWRGGRALRQAGGEDGCGCRACPGVCQRGRCPLRILRDERRRVTAKRGKALFAPTSCDNVCPLLKKPDEQRIARRASLRWPGETGGLASVMIGALANAGKLA